MNVRILSAKGRAKIHISQRRKMRISAPTGLVPPGMDQEEPDRALTDGRSYCQLSV